MPGVDSPKNGGDGAPQIGSGPRPLGRRLDGWTRAGRGSTTRRTTFGRHPEPPEKRTKRESGRQTGRRWIRADAAWWLLRVFSLSAADARVVGPQSVTQFDKFIGNRKGVSHQVRAARRRALRGAGGDDDQGHEIAHRQSVEHGHVVSLPAAAFVVWSARVRAPARDGRAASAAANHPRPPARLASRGAGAHGSDGQTRTAAR